MIFENMQKLDNSSYRSYHFVVVGAGGTGGYLIPNLARQIALRNEKVQEKSTLTIIDADIVELKNLTRQNFIQPDLGKNKAQVMAERYSRGFGLPINYIDRYVESSEDFYNILLDVKAAAVSLSPNSERNLKYLQKIVIIDCVDNTKTRHYLFNAAKRFSRPTPIDFISSGNEEFSGQIVYSSNVNKSDSRSLDSYMSNNFFNSNDFSDFDESKSFEDQKELGSITDLLLADSDPFKSNLLEGLAYQDGLIETNQFRSLSLFEIYPESMRPKDKLPSEESCAEHSVSSPQNIATNMTAANLLFGFANKLLNNVPFSEMMIIFDAATATTSTYHAKLSDMIRLLRLEDPMNPFLAAKLENNEELRSQVIDKEILTKEQVEELIHSNFSEKIYRLRKESVEAQTVTHSDNMPLELNPEQEVEVVA